MANVIKIKNKTSAGVPASGQLAEKELCVHEVDDSLYYKRESDGVVVKLNSSSGGSGLSHAQVMSRMSIGI